MEGYLQYRRLRQEINQDAISEAEKDTSKSVDFEEHDARNPRNWSMSYKIFVTSIIWLLVFVTGWASSADSTAHEIADKEFHVSAVSESLATSMYLFGVGSCAILTGPVSETLGRLTTYLSTFFVYLIWIMATALSPNFAAQIIFRFFAGFFAAASMSIYGGSLADMFDVEDRALVWPVFSLSPLLGPIVAPIATGWIVDCAGWRWIDWTTLIISAAAFIIALLFLPETFSPILLSFKAQLLRKKTGDDSHKSEQDETSITSRLGNNLSRIVYFLSRESTTLLFGTYITVLYLLIYGFLEGFDYIFTKTYLFNLGDRYAAFAAIAIGVLLGLPYMMVTNHLILKYQKRKTAKSASTSSSSSDSQGQDQNQTRSVSITPEQRLIPSLLVSPLLPISLFWLGWTNNPHISYWSDLVACLVFGFCLHALFTSTYHYLLDTYGTVASSALAAITCIRYLASGGMVIITEPMYEGLSVKWTLTLLGGIATLLAPVPWVFWWWGGKVRGRSKYAEG